MFNDSIAYIAPDGTPVDRKPKRRNRSKAILRGQVEIDRFGNITHPPISRLACFANPVEYYRGEIDRRPSYMGVERRPMWCAGCPSRPACATFAYERVELDPQLVSLRTGWEHATKHLVGYARYTHSTFVEFAVACNAKNWRSESIEQKAQRRADEAKLAKRKKREANKAARAKAISPADLSDCEQERHERQGALERAVRVHGAPTWLRNLSQQSIEFTCDVWQVRATIERRYNGVVSGGDIARGLLTVGRDHGKTEGSMRSRVSDATRRIARLECEPVDKPIWGEFWERELALPAPVPHDFVNGVNYVRLDDEQD